MAVRGVYPPRPEDEQDRLVNVMYAGLEKLNNHLGRLIREIHGAAD